MFWRLTQRSCSFLSVSPEKKLPLLAAFTPARYTSYSPRFKSSGSFRPQKPFVQSPKYPKGSHVLGIRREDASIWERRAPLAPGHVRKLVRRGVKVLVQPSNRRAYPLQAYVNAGAIIQEDISEADVIIGVKQVPVDSLLPDKTYCFFSHTIKAQEDNMPLLDAILERNIRLIDYEKMVLDNQRVVAFGKYAGLAGFINILHGLGLRLLALGHHTPFMHIGPAHNYRNSGMAAQAVRDCGYEIALGMMPKSIGPLTFVFTGSGNVSQGAQEMFQELPYEYVEPKDLPQVAHFGTTNKVYASVVRRDDHLARKEDGGFDPDDYEIHPEKYYSSFATNIAPFASVIINGIYWAVNSPRLITIPDAKRLLKSPDTPWIPSSVGSPALPHRLLAICDISADPGGSIEFMSECTTIDTPFCLYDADNHRQIDNSFAGPGVLVCSIDNMPTQIPLEATDAFGNMLFPYMSDIIKSDASKPLEEHSFGPTVSGAIIASNGKITPSFEYIMDLRQKKRRESMQASSSSGQRNVLLLGAGYVAGPLMEYLTRDSSLHVTVASALEGQSSALASKGNATALVLDVSQNGETLDQLISESDLVISILPFAFHPDIARRCIDRKKNLLTASYTSPDMRKLSEAAEAAGVTLLNEVGLDPGIDHLLAMECFDQVHSNGGKITSFVSYCGGLPAPESAENPLKYKFSWNPRAVIANTVGAARWLQNNEVIEVSEGGHLMDSAQDMNFLTGFNLEGIPNRDSTVYKGIYGIDSAHTVLRGTLRYKGFCDAMKGFIQLGLVDSTPHPSLHLGGPDLTWKQLMCRILGQQDSILTTNLRNFVLDRVQSEKRLKVIEDLGLLSDEELIEKRSSPLETLSHHLNKRLSFSAGERDVAIMRHSIGIDWPAGKQEIREINLVVYGDPNGYTAMAKCVGYPLGIAAKMLLEGEIQRKGIVMPMTTEIYHPMLKRLQSEGIYATETSIQV